MTDPLHMPENHRAFHDQRAFDGDRYKAWAAKLGSNTFRFITTLLESFSCEEQAYRSCMGVLRLSEKYGAERVEHACDKALALNSATYVTVKNILQNGMDLLQEEPQLPPLPWHENIRGSAYYL